MPFYGPCWWTQFWYDFRALPKFFTIPKSFRKGCNIVVVIVGAILGMIFSMGSAELLDDIEHELIVINGTVQFLQLITGSTWYVITRMSRWESQVIWDLGGYFESLFPCVLLKIKRKSGTDRSSWGKVLLHGKCWSICNFLYHLTEYAMPEVECTCFP